MDKKAFLNIKEIDISDIGKNICKIDPEIFTQLKLNTGDTIKITGLKSNKSYILNAIKDKITNSNIKIIRIDGNVRLNISSSLDEEVSIEKIDCIDAHSVTLAPIVEDDNKEIINNVLRDLNRTDILSYIKNELNNKNFYESNIIKIPKINTSLIVSKVNPKGPIRVTEKTKITISEKPQTGVIGITYDDIGGLKKEIEAIREMVELPIRRPEIFKRLGINPPKGVLLYGAPGTGKTLLAKAVASETDAHFITINGPEIVSGVYGKSEENLRNIFKEAEDKAPAIIFIDEIDAIAPKRESVHGDTEKRIVAQLLTLMDGLNTRNNVVVIATTNRPNSIDEALRRPGRFDREIEIGIPDKISRKEILTIHTRGMPIKDVNLNEIIELTNGFSGADVNALSKEAALKAIKRLMPEINKETGNTLSKMILDELVITHNDFLEALNVVEPSAIREVQVQIPDTKWDAIGGLENIKQQLKEMIEWPIKHKNLFDKVGVKPPAGVLLYGPSGTGKTLLAKAVATESNSNFIAIKGPEIFNKWVGESEKKIRDIFKKARQLAPTIIFFDEIDALTSNRTNQNNNGAQNNVVTQLLTEIDGISRLKDIIIIGATNRLDIIDQAFLRPGRFDKLLFVDLPDTKSREKIFDVYITKLNVDKDISTKDLAKETDKLSGAEIEAICNEAAMIAIRKAVKKDHDTTKISKKDFSEAIVKIKKEEKYNEETAVR